MALLFRVIVCLLGFFVGASAITRRAEVINFMKRENFMKVCQKRGLSVDECISEVKRHCRMQRVGSPDIDDELIACIRRPKCSQPIMDDPDQPASLNSGYKFNKRHISYFLMNTASHTKLTKKEIWKAVEMSLAVWACHANLTFTRASSIKTADIAVKFSSQYHGYVDYYTKDSYADDGNPFDGPAGTLAHGFYPIGYTTGNFHYDDEETFTEYEEEGGPAFKILPITVHEFGHTLGLKHLEDRSNIMYAYYQTYKETTIDLGPGDITEIQGRYGAKQCHKKIWQEYYRKKYEGGGDGNTDSSSGSGGTEGGSGSGGTETCKNEFDNCSKWPNCNDNDPWFLKNCKKYCGYCVKKCEDKSSKCDSYSYSDCVGSKKKWMSENCRSTCGLCGTCKNTYNSCSNWANCNDKDPWYLKNCKQYCNYCGAKRLKSTYSFKQTICTAERIDGIYRQVRNDRYTVIFGSGKAFRQDYSSKTIDPDFEFDLSAYGIHGLSAVTTSKATNLVYFFHGASLTTVPDYPFWDTSIVQQKKNDVVNYTLPIAIQSADGAFVNSAGVMRVIKGDNVFTVQIDSKVKVTKMEKLKDLFGVGKYNILIPRKVNGVFQDGRNIFFIIGSSVLKAVEQEDGRYLSVAEGARPFVTQDLGCPQTL